MALKSIFTVLVVVVLAVTLSGGKTVGKVVAEKKRREVDEVLFRSNEGGVGTSNGTEGVDNVTIAEGSGSGQMTTMVPVGDHKKHLPIRFGHWMVLGCHNDEETWGCDVRRLLHASTFGLIDTLRFTVRKDESLKMASSEEPCAKKEGAGRGKGGFRIVVQCPKNEDCNEAVLRRLKAVFFQAGFMTALVVFLGSILFCLCCCKVLKSSKPEAPQAVPKKYEARW